MKNSDNMVPLMSSLINLNIGTKNVKRQLIAVLYKIAKKGSFLILMKRKFFSHKLKKL